MSLCPSIARVLPLRSLTRCQYVLWSNTRRISTKQIKTEENSPIKEKDLAKIKVFIKDEKDNILGIKSLAEAHLMAQKHHLNLIEDKIDSQKHKYQVYKLVSNMFLAKMEAGSPEEIPSHKISPKEAKHLVFSTKLNDNDLMTKINQTKRWLSRGHNITIHVTNPKNDMNAVEHVFNQFESELKRFAKFNQKKIKSDKSLKFSIVPNPDIKEQLKASGFEDNESYDIESLGPDQLLSDEFEHKIDEELEKKH